MWYYKGTWVPLDTGICGWSWNWAPWIPSDHSTPSTTHAVPLTDIRMIWSQPASSKRLAVSFHSKTWRSHNSYTNFLFNREKSNFALRIHLKWWVLCKCMGCVGSSGHCIRTWGTERKAAGHSHWSLEWKKTCETPQCVSFAPSLVFHFHFLKQLQYFSQCISVRELSKVMYFRKALDFTIVLSCIFTSINF